jgi:uncharacterized protein (UPF0210 family)
MGGYLHFPQETLDRAVAQIKEQVGLNASSSLIWAIALEKIAEEIRNGCVKQQVEISGLDFEIE